jgi:hypothetical protein
MNNFLDTLMGMTDDRAAARRVLESRAHWDTQAACDLVMLNNHVLSEERMLAWANMSEALAGKTEDDKEETVRQKEEAERLRQEAWEKEQKERREAEERAKQVRVLLGDRIPGIMRKLGFTEVTGSDNEWQRGEWYWGTKPTGEKVSMHISDGPRGRRGLGTVFFYIEGHYPRPKDDERGYQTTIRNAAGQEMWQPQIYVSTNKTDEQVSAEIERRFMSYFNEYYKASKKIADDANKHREDTMVALQKIKGRKLDGREERDKSIYVHSPNYTTTATIKASSRRISMDISGLTPEQAKAIKKIMLGRKNPMREALDETEIHIDDVSVEQAREILAVIDAETVTEALGGKSEEDKEATVAAREAEAEARRKKAEAAEKIRLKRIAREEKLEKKGERNKKLFPRFIPRMLRSSGFTKIEQGGWRYEYSAINPRTRMKVDVGVYRNKLNLSASYVSTAKDPLYYRNLHIDDMETVIPPTGWINAGYDLKVIDQQFKEKFLPRVNHYREMVTKYQEQQAAEQSAEEALLASVKGTRLTPKEISDERLEFRGSGLRGYIRIDDLGTKKLELDLDDISEEQAQRIYTFLKTFKKDVQEGVGKRIHLRDLTVDQAKQVLQMLGPIQIEEALAGKSEEDIEATRDANQEWLSIFTYKAKELAKLLGTSFMKWGKHEIYGKPYYVGSFMGKPNADGMFSGASVIVTVLHVIVRRWKNNGSEFNPVGKTEESSMTWRQCGNDLDVMAKFVTDELAKSGLSTTDSVIKEALGGKSPLDKAETKRLDALGWEGKRTYTPQARRHFRRLEKKIPVSQRELKALADEGDPNKLLALYGLAVGDRVTEKHPNPDVMTARGVIVDASISDCGAGPYEVWIDLKMGRSVVGVEASTMKKVEESVDEALAGKTPEDKEETARAWQEGLKPTPEQIQEWAIHIGDKVTVIHPGSTFTMYDVMARALGATRWDRSNTPEKGSVVTVKNIGLHEDDSRKIYRRILYLIEAADGNQYVIGRLGIDRGRVSNEELGLPREED